MLKADCLETGEGRRGISVVLEDRIAGKTYPSRPEAKKRRRAENKSALFFAVDKGSEKMHTGLVEEEEQLRLGSKLDSDRQSRKGIETFVRCRTRTKKWLELNGTFFEPRPKDQSRGNQSSRRQDPRARAAG
jgi:hypothetical protein